MADEVGETEDDGTAIVITMDTSESQSLRVSRLDSPSAMISKTQILAEHTVTFAEAPEVGPTEEGHIPLQMSKSDDDKLTTVSEKNPLSPNLPRRPRSACRSRSRDTRQCQKHFQEMIGKHEMLNDELEKREGDMRQRLEMLECSMPAVMSWNIWRMAQNAPASTVRRLLEKQFHEHGEGNPELPNSPSQHYDCRVREIEAERKEALRRAEEARHLLEEKEAAVRERRKQLEEAKKCSQERKERMEKLNREAAELRAALKNARGDDNSCETGECGEIRCKEKWLDSVGSVSSIGSEDLECFAKLQELAESEICMKRQISELERREEAYMRTLQQADELWSKMEGDTVDTVSGLQDQLDAKTAANQQLADRICLLEDQMEKLKMKLVGCREALSEFTDKKFSDVEVGFDDGEATVADRGVIAAVKTAAASSVATPTTADQETTALPDSVDEGSSVVPESADAGSTAVAKMLDKDTEATVDQTDREVDRPTGLGIDAGVGNDEVQIEETKMPTSMAGALRRLKQRGSKPIEGEDNEDDEDIPEHWKNWNWDEGCPPDAICDDMVESSTVTDDLERPKGVTLTESKVQAMPEVVDQPVGGRGTEDLAVMEDEVVLPLTHAPEQVANPSMTSGVMQITKGADESEPVTDQIVLSREELRNWYNIVDSVHHMISKCVNCSAKMEDTAQLAERMKLHLRIKGLSGVKEPSVPKELAIPEALPDSRRDDYEIRLIHDKEQTINGTIELLPVEVEQLALTGDPEIIVSSEDGIRPDDTMVSKPLEEAVANAIISDTTPQADGLQGILSEFPEKSDQPTDNLGDQSAEEIMPVLSHHELPEQEAEVAEVIPENNETFPAAESISPAVPVEETVETETIAEVTHISIDETVTPPIEFSEELAIALSVPTEIEVETTDSKDPSEQPLQVADIEAEIEQPSIVPVEDEESKSPDTEEEARVKETVVSFITPRTPPPSRIDVQLRRETQDFLDEIEQISESVAESLIRSEELGPAEISLQPETPDRTTTEATKIRKTRVEPVTSPIRSPPDKNKPEQLADKVPDKISSDGRIAKVPESSVAEKVLPKGPGQCFCEPLIGPLLGRIASRESTLKAPKLFTEGTQTSRQIPKGLLERLDKLKLKTITESTWPSPEVRIWRHPMAWPRRPRDKSALTTACVDTQTDSALVRERIALEGIDRKDRTTCSGLRPRTTKHGGCSERIPAQPPAVGLACAELFGSSMRFPTSVFSSAEKELAVVKYDGRSSMPQKSELYCIECGRPITPDGTPLSEEPSPSTSSNSQKSIMASMKRTSSSSLSMGRKKDAFTCCDCKLSDHRKIKEIDGSRKKRKIDKSVDKSTIDEDRCPCDAETLKNTKLSKSAKKKRKPEKKDQGVTANIPKSKKTSKSKKAKNDETASIANAKGSTLCLPSIVNLKMILSSTATEVNPDTNEMSGCACDEDSATFVSLPECSYVPKEKIAKDGSSYNSTTDKSSMNIPRNGSSTGSDPSEEGICNCLPPTP